MTYRDDLDAAHARTQAAERRVRELEGRLVAQTRDKEQLLARPVSITVDEVEDGVRLVIAPYRELGDLVMVVTSIGLVALSIYGLITEPLSIGSFVLLAFALVFAYGGSRHYVNHTRIDVSLERLRFARGPIPERATELVATRVRQLFVQLQSSRRSETLWELCAIVDDDEHQTLLVNLTRAEAVFIERVIEQRMGIVDRPVAGELRTGS